MNKILTAVAAVLSCTAAFATPSWATVNSAAYDEDTPSQDSASTYRAYLCTAEAAQEAFNADSIDGITTYFVKHFTAGKATLASLAGIGTTDDKLSGGATSLDAPEWGRGQYSFTTYFAPDNLTANDSYFGILLYVSDADEQYAVRVFSATSDGTTWLADDSESRSAGTAGEWTASPVPEPTSGLLLLLGMAGLCLRRKQK